MLHSRPIRFALCLSVCLAAFPTIAGESGQGEVVRVTDGLKKTEFSYRITLDSDRDAYRVYRLTYPSPVQSALPQNNTIPAEYYLPKGIKPGARPRPQ